MCRYAFHQYKEPFACFTCRKVFKQTSRWALPPGQRPAPGEKRRVLCPRCRAPMADMGYAFKAPKQTDTEQWAKVQLLYEHGFDFYSCGCCGPGYRPATLREVKAWLQSNRQMAEGERLLESIQASATTAQGRRSARRRSAHEQ